MPSLMLLGDGLAAVLAVALLLTCQWQLTAAQLLQQGEVEVSTASQLSAALKDPNVWDILVTADIDMASELASWAALPADIPVTHNLTIHGRPGQHPAIDFRYWQFNGSTPPGLALGPGVTFTFRYLVIRSSYDVLPGLVQSLVNTSFLLVDNCISHKYVLGSPQQVLALFLGAPLAPWETPGYRQGVALPAGYCRTAPNTPMCWKNAIMLFAYTTTYSSSKNATAVQVRVDMTKVVTVWESILTPNCSALFYQGNSTCVRLEINQILETAPPGSFWFQPTPSPERVATIMAAYESTMSAYYQSRAGLSPAASTPEPAPTSSSSTAFFPLPGVYVVVGAVVGVMGIAAAVCWLLARRRATAHQANKGGLEAISDTCEVQQPGQGDAKHQSAPEPSSRDVHITLGDPASTSIGGRELMQEASELSIDQLSAAGLQPEVTSFPSMCIQGDWDAAKNAGNLHLETMIVPSTPIKSSLVSNLKLGVDVILGDKIGRGGMGTVYAATYKGQPVAVKLLHAAAHPRNFLSELAVLGRTHHPNVVSLIGSCVDGDQLALVEELADGSLEEVLFQARAAGGSSQLGAEEPKSLFPTLLHLPLVLHIAMEVATGLAYLHPTIIHRDLKPGNVLLKVHPSFVRGDLSQGLDVTCCDEDYQGIQAKLSDFGLARIFDSLVLITQQPLKGTLTYVAPECFLNKTTLTHKCDIYSFGILLWEMVHGRRAWQGLSQSQMMYAMAVARLRPAITADETRCPPALRHLIERCWHSDVHVRPPALEIVRMLTVIQRQIRSHANGPSQIPPGKPS